MLVNSSLRQLAFPKHRHKATSLITTCTCQPCRYFDDSLQRVEEESKHEHNRVKEKYCVANPSLADSSTPSDGTKATERRIVESLIAEKEVW